ncbi:MAG TPA: PilZ domain-containing protein [Terriglobales bacterium]|nr:PilZ domain-containing protein [Terriglobales bacterium]
MTTSLANTSDALNTRLWPRYHVCLPVLVSAEGDSSKIAVPGLACEISQRGMALYGGIDLQLGDLMAVEFQNSGKVRVAGIIRSRSGFCFGLEFLERMTSTEAMSDMLEAASAAEEPGSWKAWFASHRGDAFVAIATALLLFTLFAAGAPSPYQVAQPKTNQPSLTLSEQMLVALGLAEMPPAPVVRGNPNVRVWVDLHTALYHCPGSELYGKTPDGKFTTQRDAQLDQFEPAARKSCE